jgi:hypothetical protein
MSQVLGMLEGLELGAITFVRDYMQFHFDGPYLNAYVWPVVRRGERVLRRGEIGFLESLHALIGKTVVAAVVHAKDKIEIRFDDHVIVSIWLRPEDSVRGESAMFQDGTGKFWEIW